MTDFSVPDNSRLRHQVRDILAVIPRVFAFVWRVSPVMFLLMMILMVASALAPAAAIWMTKVIIDTIIDAAANDRNWTIIIGPVGIIIGIWFIQAISAAAQETMDTVLGEHVSYSAEQQILEKASTLDLAFFDSPMFYDQLHQASTQCDRIQYIAQASMSLLQSAVGFAAVIGLLTVLHPLAIAVLIACALPRILLEGVFAKRHFDFESEYVRNRRMGSYLVRLLTSRDSVKEVRVFRLKDLFIRRFVRLRDAQLSGLRRLLVAYLKLHGGLDVLSLAGIASIWAYAVYEGVLSRITIGEVALVLQAAQQGQTLLRSVVEHGAGVYRDALFATRFFNFLSMDTRGLEGALVRPGVKSMVPVAMRTGISLMDVRFKYPGSEKYVLNGVSFDIAAGSKVAIVGENGAGKTTLVKLLCRLYDPSSGLIQIDGRDYKDCRVDDLHRHIGVIFQDYYRYHLSAADNIGVGHVEAIGLREQIEAAAKRGGARETIDALPSGFDTILGREFEDGADLSGGEWQQVAMSRAFMSDADILILDEPTAALDAFHEQRLYEQFAAFTESKTIVFVSHRFSTVKMADLIVVLSNGVVAELGSHEQLVALGGKYAAMFSAQASRYQ